jgi:hypothetical protein
MPEPGGRIRYREHQFLPFEETGADFTAPCKEEALAVASVRSGNPNRFLKRALARLRIFRLSSVASAWLNRAAAVSLHAYGLNHNTATNAISGIARIEKMSGTVI